MNLSLLNLILGGILGTISRYYLSQFSIRIFSNTFPYGTFLVNILGCFLIGVFSSVLNGKHFFPEPLKLLFIVGFCGAFTTFSTFIFECEGLIQSGDHFKALLNVFLSIILGFISLRFGILIGNRFFSI